MEGFTQEINLLTNYSSNYIRPAWETSIHKLQCALGICSWNKLNQELQTGRRDFVAVSIYDAWTACKPGEKVSKSVDETNICYGNDCFSD